MADTQHPAYKMEKEELLLQLLKKEHGYYKSIQDIATKENEILNTNQPISDLRSLLKKKKILLSCISEIEVAMAPLKKYWQGKSDHSDHTSQGIREELNSLGKLLKNILQLDLLSQKTMENHMLFLKEKNKALSEQS